MYYTLLQKITKEGTGGGEEGKRGGREEGRRGRQGDGRDFIDLRDYH
jgi:hypothetical protein